MFLAACLAYVITYIIRSFQRWIDRRVEKTFVVRSLDVPGVYEKCRELFPIEKITFQGKEFTRGMRVKVTNKMNLVCIRTNSQIIAHQLEKIQEIRSI